MIEDYEFDNYDMIDYWAIADMQNGEESKVIGFEVPKDTITGVKDGKIYATILSDYVDNLYILPSLLE